MVSDVVELREWLALVGRWVDQCNTLIVERDALTARVKELEADALKWRRAVVGNSGPNHTYETIKDGEAAIGFADELRTLQCETVEGLTAEVAKLVAFKSYVHQRLDEAGVPVDPPSPHREAGCRIGGRLDVVLNENAKLREALKELMRFACRPCDDGPHDDGFDHAKTLAHAALGATP